MFAWSYKINIFAYLLILMMFISIVDYKGFDANVFFI